MVRIWDGAYAFRSASVNRNCSTALKGATAPEERSTILPDLGIEVLTMNEADGRPQNAQSWKRLYEAAILEVNEDTLLRRINAAHKAVTERTLDLLRGGADNKRESEDLMNATGVLDDLKRMYHSDGEGKVRHLDGNS